AYRGCEFNIEPVVSSAEQSPIGDGCSLLLMAHTDTGCILASSCVGERGLPAETVATRAAEQLLANVEAGGCVDEYMQDQLILFLALAKGTSILKTGPLTLHTRTCLFWAQYFTGARVRVHKAKNNSSLQTPEPSDTEETVIIEIE